MVVEVKEDEYYKIVNYIGYSVYGRAFGELRLSKLCQISESIKKAANGKDYLIVPDKIRSRFDTYDATYHVLIPEPGEKIPETIAECTDDRYIDVDVLAPRKTKFLEDILW